MAFEVAKDLVVCKNFGVLAVSSFFCQRSGQRKGCPTKRAADGWESAASRSIFLASSFSCSRSFISSHPPAANANRWAVELNKAIKNYTGVW